MHDLTDDEVIAKGMTMARMMEWYHSYLEIMQAQIFTEEEDAEWLLKFFKEFYFFLKYDQEVRQFFMLLRMRLLLRLFASMAVHVLVTNFAVFLLCGQIVCDPFLEKVKNVAPRTNFES